MTKEEGTPLSRAVRPLHVLVVEDNVLVRRLLLEYLAFDGHTAEAAGDGREGWAKFRAGRFDVVLTDRAMPGLTGDLLASAVKQMAPGTPIVMVTGYGAEIETTGERVPDVDAVVGKPLTLAVLQAALAQAMAREAPRAARPRPPRSAPAQPPPGG